MHPPFLSVHGPAPASDSTLVPFQRISPGTLTPPAVVNGPTAYNARPVPSSKVSRSPTAPPTVSGTVQFAPSYARRPFWCPTKSSAPVPASNRATQNALPNCGFVGPSVLTLAPA